MSREVYLNVGAGIYHPSNTGLIFRVPKILDFHRQMVLARQRADRCDDGHPLRVMCNSLQKFANEYIMRNRGAQGLDNDERYQDFVKLVSSVYKSTFLARMEAACDILANVIRELGALYDTWLLSQRQPSHTFAEYVCTLDLASLGLGGFALFFREEVEFVARNERRRVETKEFLYGKQHSTPIAAL